jgi:hypothetical protein
VSTILDAYSHLDLKMESDPESETPNSVKIMKMDEFQNKDIISLIIVHVMTVGPCHPRSYHQNGRISVMFRQTMRSPPYWMFST